MVIDCEGGAKVLDFGPIRQVGKSSYNTSSRTGFQSGEDLVRFQFVVGLVGQLQCGIANIRFAINNQMPGATNQGGLGNIGLKSCVGVKFQVALNIEPAG